MANKAALLAIRAQVNTTLQTTFSHHALRLIHLQSSNKGGFLLQLTYADLCIYNTIVSYVRVIHNLFQIDFENSLNHKIMKRLEKTTFCVFI